MKLEKEIAFILAIDALKNIQRRNYILDDSRRENSAEHSWQLIVFAQVLYPYAKYKAQIDLHRVLKMLSIHDIVEIDAGDTFAFDEKAMEGKYARELASARRIFGILDEPIRSEFLNLWEEFEAATSADAIFANAVDRVMPFILNAHTAAKSWKEASVTAGQARKVIEQAVKRASDELGDAFEELLQRAVDTGRLFS